MKHKPKVAVVGRPNVGKSTLVNRILKERKSIVHDEEGVTRDRLYFDAKWQNKTFSLIDTGGIVMDSVVSLYLNIFSQVRIACEEADVILFVVDGNDGLSPVDEDIANIIRKSGKKIYLVVNKIDTPEKKVNSAEFYALSLGEPWALSALHGTGAVGDLLDDLTKDFPEDEEKEEEKQVSVDDLFGDQEKIEQKEETEKAVRIAIVGKPNVGKSSIVNSLLNEERVIVADESGTTRDSIDSEVKWGDNKFILIDTAGIRKKSKVDWGVEKFAVDRAIKSIRSSDVAILVIDVTAGISDQDKKIATTIIEAGKGFIIAFNKCDLLKETDKTIAKLKKTFEKEIPFFSYVPKIFISAKNNKNLESIYKHSLAVYKYCQSRIATGLLNKVVNDAFLMNPPSSQKGKMLKIYYTTQVKTAPPTFVFFVNNKELIKQGYRKYLENSLREAFGFIGTPIKMALKEKKEDKK
ncbi:ribosome biogenesis GTPase Der [bacterium]|nr:ribosome biogenesis GTPase Der [bacterium]